MGANSSSNRNAHNFSLSENELINLKEQFKSLHNDQTDSKVSGSRIKSEKLISKADFHNGFKHELQETITESLFNVMNIESKLSTETMCNESGFLLVIDSLTKGSFEEKIPLTFKFLAGRRECVSYKSLISILEEILKVYITASKEENLPDFIHSCDMKNINVMSIYLVHDLCYPYKKLKDVIREEVLDLQEYSINEIEPWLQKCPLVNIMLSYILLRCFLPKNDYCYDIKNIGFYVPELYFTNAIPQTHLLDSTTISLLNSNLPKASTSEWTLLFSSAVDGQSFSTLVKQIRNQGSTVILIEDKAGYVFGGFASESWEYNANFTGDDSCFLFTLHPKIGIYETTGYNNHYMYLNQNQQTLPNGLGMGGQLNYFGFWIDSDYGKGKCSSSCTTFTSPMLSSQESFDIKKIEIWRVGPKPKPLEEDEDSSSILDKNPEAKALLLLINKQPVSEGLREEDPKADSPEDKIIPSH